MGHDDEIEEDEVDENGDGDEAKAKKSLGP